MKGWPNLIKICKSFIYNKDIYIVFEFGNLIDI